MVQNLISQFHVAVLKDHVGEVAMDPIRVNQHAMQLGYIVHPDCCTESVFNWLLQQEVNYNATFYKTWEDVVRTSKIEWMVDQLIHYAYAYHAGISVTPNDRKYSDVPNIEKFTIIRPIGHTDLLVKIVEVLELGIALKESTQEDFLDYIKFYRDTYGIKLYDYLKLDTIKNREMLARICYELNHYPASPINILRLIYFHVTGHTTIIRNSQSIESLRYGRKFNLSLFSRQDLEKLAIIFNRYKWVFVALKQHSGENAKIVNYIGKLSKKLHKPMVKGFWESVLEEPMPLKNIHDQLEKNCPNNFKLIQLIQACEERMTLSICGGYRMYAIRNGKQWMDTNPMHTHINPISIKFNYLNDVKNMMYDRLVNNIKDKACTVRFPKYLQLSCPTSEKNFIGNIPMGSHFKLTQNNTIGIYWREEWGAHDFDLSFASFDGDVYAWNHNFKNNDCTVLYSGDMVEADPEAAEHFFISKNCPSGIFRCTLYHGDDNSKFRFIVGQSDKDFKNEDELEGMINPNHIQFAADIDIVGKMTQLGFVVGDKLYISNFNVGNSRVVGLMSERELEQVSKTYFAKSTSYLDLRKVLLDAGFKERKRPSIDNPIKIDFEELKKDDIINIFS